MQYQLRQAHYYDKSTNRTLLLPVAKGTKEICWQQAQKRKWVEGDIDIQWWDDSVDFHNSYCTIQRVTP
jgi:hypothetical protein